MPVDQRPRPIALDSALAVEYLADALTREDGSIGDRTLDALLDRLVALARSHDAAVVETLAANPDDDATRRTVRAMILGSVEVDGAFGHELVRHRAAVRRCVDRHGPHEPRQVGPARRDHPLSRDRC